MNFLSCCLSTTYLSKGVSVTCLSDCLVSSKTRVLCRRPCFHGVFLCREIVIGTARPRPSLRQKPIDLPSNSIHPQPNPDPYKLEERLTTRPKRPEQTEARQGLAASIMIRKTPWASPPSISNCDVCALVRLIFVQD